LTLHKITHKQENALGQLEATFEDGFRVTITPHSGTRALRVKNLLKKVGAATLKALAEARKEQERKMSKEDLEAIATISSKFSTDLPEKEQEKLDEELKQISLKYESAADNLKAMAEANAEIDPDVEEELTLLIFQNTTFNNGKQGEAKLSGSFGEKAMFDLVFTGKAAGRIEPIKKLIVDFNDFLDQGRNSQPEKALEQSESP